MNRGEIWVICLDPTVGSEINKARPAVIVNDDAIGILPLKIIVPITEWKDRYSVSPWMVRLGPDNTTGLEKPSVADAFQVRSVSKKRFIRQIGILSDTTMKEIAGALATVLAIQQ